MRHFLVWAVMLSFGAQIFGSLLQTTTFQICYFRASGGIGTSAVSGKVTQSSGFILRENNTRFDGAGIGPRIYR